MCRVSQGTCKDISDTLDQENHTWLRNSQELVCNLSFLSKLIERIICVQLVNHLDKNGLCVVFQSAYRQLHSTETALLRAQNYTLQAVDSRGGAILVLLDPTQCCIWHYWSWKTYKNTWYILCHKWRSSQMLFYHIWKAVFSLYKYDPLSLESKIYSFVFLKTQSWGPYFSQSTQPLLVELSRGMG